MKKQLLAASVLCSALLAPQQAIAASLSGLYVFGDSLSDTGNAFTATGGFVPPAPYVNGRFSNGPVWIDYLGQRLNLTPTPIAQVLGGAPAPQGINFAFGGATSGAANTIVPFLPGLNPGQLSLVPGGLAPNTLDKNGLYIVWAGANDYLPTTSSFIPKTTPTDTITNIGTSIAALAGAGARNFLVVDLPQLGQTPLGQSQGSPQADALNQLTTSHNLALQQQVALLNSTLPGTKITTLTVSTLFEQAIAGQLGFANTTTPCLAQPDLTLCDQFLFWDEIHPTTKAHSLIAKQAYQTLQQAAYVPEPTTIVGLLTIGVVGAGSLVNKRRRQTLTATVRSTEVN